ncbi:transcription factor ILR3-like isoform X2 [Cucurbita maxima]|nr:transcription factor ILR3-like isoform X2 [Cucurbita maxima]XP_022986347.1 transcription factor ILR3-like isoform X2 [Cucurbita maxima]
MMNSCWHAFIQTIKSSSMNRKGSKKQKQKGNWNWLFDYSTMEDLPVVGAHFSPPQSVSFSWSNPSINFPSDKHSLEVDCSYEDLDSLKEVGRKRLKAETSSASTSKAWREKLRRDKLNERFLELSAVLEPGKLPKTDKVAILSDAIRMMTDLQCEIEKLKESEDDLKEKIKELKVEKNELRDEKQRLRAEKEKLEVQIKAVNARAAADIQHPPPTLSAAFTAQGQAAGNKLMPFIGYPGIAMWQFLPPATVDTSQDHVLRPPVA